MILKNYHLFLICKNQESLENSINQDLAENLEEMINLIYFQKKKENPSSLGRKRKNKFFDLKNKDKFID